MADCLKESPITVRVTVPVLPRRLPNSVLFFYAVKLLAASFHATVPNSHLRFLLLAVILVAVSATLHALVIFKAIATNAIAFSIGCRRLYPRLWSLNLRQHPVPFCMGSRVRRVGSGVRSTPPADGEGTSFYHCHGAQLDQWWCSACR